MNEQAEQTKQRGNIMSNHPPLDSWRFDAVTAGPERIWGQEAIARAIGKSVASVRRYASRPDVPIYRPGGQYFALRSELNAWLRTK